MKTAFVGLLTAGLVSGGAFAAPAKTLETVNVKSIELRGNFMPPLPPGEHLPTAFLTVQVPSNGCTEARDFRVVVTDGEEGKRLSIIRTKADHCRAYFPEGTEIELRVPRVRMTDKVLIANPAFLIDKTTH